MDAPRQQGSGEAVAGKRMTGCYRASCTRSVRPSSGCGAGRRPAGPGHESTGGGGAAGISPAAERGRDVCDDHQQSCSSQELSLAQTCRQKLMRRGKTNKRMKRFEPRPSPWQGDALPLSYIRKRRRMRPSRPGKHAVRRVPWSRGGGAGWGCQESPNSKEKMIWGIKRTWPKDRDETNGTKRGKRKEKKSPKQEKGKKYTEKSIDIEI